MSLCDKCHGGQNEYASSSCTFLYWVTYSTRDEDQAGLSMCLSEVWRERDRKEVAYAYIHTHTHTLTHTHTSECDRFTLSEDRLKPSWELILKLLSREFTTTNISSMPLLLRPQQSKSSLTLFSLAHFASFFEASNMALQCIFYTPRHGDYGILRAACEKLGFFLEHIEEHLRRSKVITKSHAVFFDALCLAFHLYLLNVCCLNWISAKLFWRLGALFLIHLWDLWIPNAF